MYGFAIVGAILAGLTAGSLWFILFVAIGIGFRKSFSWVSEITGTIGMVLYLVIIIGSRGDIRSVIPASIIGILSFGALTICGAREYFQSKVIEVGLKELSYIIAMGTMSMVILAYCATYL